MLHIILFDLENSLLNVIIEKKGFFIIMTTLSLIKNTNNKVAKNDNCILCKFN